MKRLLIVLAVLGLIIPSVSAAYGYYTIPIQATTNTPLDSLTNYLGDRPQAPGITEGQNKVYIPTTGVIERVDIYDNSTTQTSNEAYSYYIKINSDPLKQYLIATLTTASKEHVFINYSPTLLAIPVTAGDYFEIKRIHPAWATNPVANTVGGFVVINATTEPGFVMPMTQLTSNPANNVWNYMNYRPVAMSTTDRIYALDSPAGGNITKVNIYDNSTVPGSNEVFAFYVQVNEGSSVPVTTVSAATSERLFRNNVMAINVTAGDSIEFKRLNPTRVALATGNTVGGSAFINTQYEPTTIAKGYPLFIQALSATPVDTLPYYLGNRPYVPVIYRNANKIYVPKAGTINKAYLNVYATTVGTGEAWSYYIRKNDATDYLIETISSINAMRTFDNQSMGIPVVVGDYIEVKAIPPAWVTNPAITHSGYVYVDYTTPTTPGGDVVLPPIADFAVNLTPTPTGTTAQFFSLSNNTIDGSTTYSWNFTDGGVKEDSALQNPTFLYSTIGTYTVRLTVTTPGPVTDTMTKNNYITVYTPTASTPTPTPTPCPPGSWCEWPVPTVTPTPAPPGCPVGVWCEV